MAEIVVVSCKAIATIPERIMVLSNTPLVRVSSLRPSSSTAKAIPARGVLNAAAIPAAPPASIRSSTRMIRALGRKRWKKCMIEAATCTDGPSRPAEKPPVSASAPRPILPKAIRSETSLSTLFPCLASFVAAITWGMPLPWEPLKNGWSTRPRTYRSEGCK